MRLISAFLAFFLGHAATAQTLPGPEDYDAAVVAALADSYAYCTTRPGASPHTLAAFLQTAITLEFRDANELERHVRQGDAFAAITRMIADGTVISDDDGIRLPDCPVTDAQITARLRFRTRTLETLPDVEGVALLSGAMTAYGCSIARADEAAFVEFALRHVAGLYDIPLPDPLPEGEDRELTPFVEALYNVLDNAGTDMRRSGAMITDDEAARLVGCVASDAPPDPPVVTFGTDPEGAAAHAALLRPEDMQAIFAQTMADIGCALPDGDMTLFSTHFRYNGLLTLGVDLPPDEVAHASRDLALTGQTDHAYGAAIAAFDYYETLLPTMMAVEDAGLLDYEDPDAVVLIDCIPTGDLPILSRYEIDEEQQPGSTDK